MSQLYSDQQLHGYRRGHELMASSISLSREDQDLVDRLSDIAGQVRPGERFFPYLTAYPLPSGKFYVLAKTWQDEAAPRAGCVLTRSLLIPMSQWIRAESVGEYEALLKPFPRTVENVERAHLIGSSQPQVLHEASPLTELVEALFLENRKPIVVFGADGPEAISARLLSALWPSMKRRFSLSTFALAPRIINRSYFDLVFAPQTARSRFSDWEGRRIDLSGTYEARHAWANYLTDVIFGSDAATPLLKLDALGLLRDDEHGDESALRISLLWNELWQQLDRSPIAMLGLVDILNSRQLTSRAMRSLTPVICNSLRLAERQEEPQEILIFCEKLLKKLVDCKISLGVLREVRRVSLRVAITSPIESLEYIAKRQQEPAYNHVHIIAGIGLGLSKTADRGALMKRHDPYYANSILLLIAYSIAFARRLMSDGGKVVGLDQWSFAFENTSILKKGLKNRVRRNLLPSIKSAKHAGILLNVLRDADDVSVVRAVTTVWYTTHFSVREFDSAFVEAVRDQRSLDSLRRRISQFPETRSSNRFLLATVRLTREDMAWICSSEDLQKGRAAHLLVAFLKDVADWDIKRVLQDDATSIAMASALMVSFEDSGQQLLRVLRLGTFPFRYLVDMSGLVFPLLDQNVRLSLAESIIMRGLADASGAANDGLATVIKNADFVPSKLVDLVLAVQVDDERVEANLMLLFDLAGEFRDAAAARIFEFSERLIRISSATISSQAVSAWTALLVKAGEFDSRQQISGAWLCLEYALKSLRSPLDAMAVAAYPIVFGALRSGHQVPAFTSIFMFFDWDRCKSIRKQFVRAYMESTWAPSGLLLSAVMAGDASATLTRVAGEWGGRAYLNAIERDVARLDGVLRKSLTDALQAYRDGTNKLSFWD